LTSGEAQHLPSPLLPVRMRSTVYPSVGLSPNVGELIGQSRSCSLGFSKAVAMRSNAVAMRLNKADVATGYLRDGGNVFLFAKGHGAFRP